MNPKRKIPTPKSVWVTFDNRGLPDGVTMLKDEADQWKSEGSKVVRYDREKVSK